MENEDRATRGISRSDIDAQGNVVLWDHGPSAPGPLVEADSDEYKRLEAEAKAWHAKYGDSAMPVTMNSGDARHALEVEPQRYSLDPDVNEADVDAEIAKIVEQREKEKQAADERAAAVQLAADRKQAIANLQTARRAAEAEAKLPKPRVTQYHPEPEPAEPKAV